MSGKVIIYGAVGGIGEALARKLAADGKKLHLVGRGEDELEELADELDATYTVGNVTNEALFKQVSEEAGKPIDGLVYAVGSINLGTLNRLTPELAIEDFKVNALGAALAVQAALPGLKKSDQNPGVVLFSSIAVQMGFAMHSSVSMAKGAVEGLGKTLAAELAPKIRVNVIAPSLTKTPLAAPMLANDQVAEAIAKMHPIPKLGEANEVASLAAFLLSEQASWITGQVMHIDGGRSTIAGK